MFKNIQYISTFWSTLTYVLLFSAIGLAKPKEIRLEGRLINYGEDKVEVNYQSYALLEKLKKQEVTVDKDGKFYLTIAAEAPIRAFLSLGKKQVSETVHIKNPDGSDTTMTMGTTDARLVFFYLTPGEHLKFSVDADHIEETLGFEGRQKDNSLLLNNMEWEFNSYTEKHLKNYYSIVHFSPIELLRYADNKANEKQAYLTDFAKRHKVSKHLLQVLQLESSNTAVVTKISYPEMRKTYLKLDVVDLPSDYYSFMDDVILPKGLRNKGIAYFYFLDHFLQKKYRMSGATDDFYDQVGHWLDGYELYEYLAFALGRDFKRKIYDRFGADCPYQELAVLVKHRYKELEGMLEGSPAPMVTLQDTSRGAIQLSDLKGKYVFIDFWATWCGPCIKEIPSLQELENAYHEQNIVFLSISFDTVKDREKWIQFVRDRSLTGMQYWVDAENKAVFSKQFNIQQIPRFILLDPDGAVVDANAPRPSQPAIQQLLNEVLHANVKADAQVR